MAFYTVLTPPSSPGVSEAEQLEKTVFLKDGFVISAFIFTGLWLLAKRLWLAFAIFLIIWGMIALGGRWIGINPLALVLAQALIGLFLGLEGHNLIERQLIRKGWTLAGVVEGRELDTVERRFFELGRDGGTAALQRPALSPLAAAPGRLATTAPTSTVLGLFPDQQGRA